MFIYLFGWCFNYGFYSSICGHLHPSESFSSNISGFIVIFECSLTDCFICVLFHIILWPKWCNYVCFGFFYDGKAKNFWRIFAAIDNLYIALYRYDVSEHCDVGEHMGFWSYIQLCSAKFDGSWMKCFIFCPLISQLQYWKKYSGSSMMFSLSLWWIDIMPGFIVEFKKLWSSSRWIYSSSSSVIKS